MTDDIMTASEEGTKADQRTTARALFHWYIYMLPLRHVIVGKLVQAVHNAIRSTIDPFW